jgi:radical SAM superfamily enzyme YgiQ (UPF0313 family)
MRKNCKHGSVKGDREKFLHLLDTPYHQIAMAKVMLINPPWGIMIGDPFNEIPIGLGYLASFLKANGHDVLIYNADFRKHSHASHLSRFCNYSSYQRVLRNLAHPLWQAVRKQIAQYSPNIVGIHIKTSSYTSARNVAKLIKEHDHRIVTVVGGPHATILPVETARDQYFDFVIKGEGEKTLLELVNAIDTQRPFKDIRGLTFLQDSKIVNNHQQPLIDDLDQIPFIERDAIVDRDKYTPHGLGLIFTARGCPYECTYCASKQTWGRKVRFRSANNVFEEIKEVYNRYNCRYFKFRDDTFTLNKKRAHEICDLIIQEGLDISWHCDTRTDCIDESLVKKMKQAGCDDVSVGIESGSDRILKLIKKGETREQMEEAVTVLKKYGIKVKLFIMIGFPTETEKEMTDTVKFAKELQPNHIIISILTPYPGTELYYGSTIEHSVREGILHWDAFFHQSPMMGMGENNKRSRRVIKRCLKEVERYNMSMRGESSGLPLLITRAKTFLSMLLTNPRTIPSKLIRLCWQKTK